jgi:hypothetical protein
MLASDRSLEHCDGNEAGYPVCLQMQVDVPVTVNVMVDAGEACNMTGTTINVPVQVDVSVEIVIEGRPIGKGSDKLVFGKCDRNASKAWLWQQCGGVTYMQGAATNVLKACEDGMCIRKNPWFAQCIPRSSRKLFKLSQGWSGEVVRCRNN